MPWKQTAETKPCEMGPCPILFRAGGGGRASSGPFIFLQSLLYHVLNRKCTEVGGKRRCLQIICVSVLALLVLWVSPFGLFLCGGGIPALLTWDRQSW